MSSNTDKEIAKETKMERSKDGAASQIPSDEEKVQQVEGSGSDAENNPANTDTPVPEPSTAARVPFTSLSQVDSDMALARALQEQVIFSLNSTRCLGLSSTQYFYLARVIKQFACCCGKGCQSL